MAVKKNKVTELEAKISSLNDNLLRSLADYANLQKRQSDQQQMILSLTQATIITPLIDVLEDLYRADEHLKDDGLKMAINRFVSTLKDQGLTEINAEGQEFDPAIMECVETADGKENSVLIVRRRGYSLNDHCLRPAQVVVGKKSEISN